MPWLQMLISNAQRAGIKSLNGHRLSPGLTLGHTGGCVLPIGPGLS